MQLPLNPTNSRKTCRTPTCFKTSMSTRQNKKSTASWNQIKTTMLAHWSPKQDTEEQYRSHFREKKQGSKLRPIQSHLQLNFSLCDLNIWRSYKFATNFHLVPHNLAAMVLPLIISHFQCFCIQTSFVDSYFVLLNYWLHNAVQWFCHYSLWNCD